jgi:phage terminase large subunit GpA-like protein
VHSAGDPAARGTFPTRVVVCWIQAVHELRQRQSREAFADSRWSREYETRRKSAAQTRASNQRFDLFVSGDVPKGHRVIIAIVGTMRRDNALSPASRLFRIRLLLLVLVVVIIAATEQP